MNLVRYEVDGAFATITLDSPANRNAISEQLLDELIDTFATVRDDDAIRAVVLTHTGNTFSAGGALSARDGETRTPAEISSATTLRMVDLLRAMLELPKPIVAQVDGHVRAGGLGLLCACDLAVAGPASTFALTEVRLGVSPAMISVVVIPKLNGRNASRYFLTGEKFDAARAEEIGLITLADADPAAAVRSLLTEFGAASPQGLAETKRLLTRDMLAAFDARAEELAALSARLFSSEQGVEGIMAFLQRRDPAWKTTP